MATKIYCASTNMTIQLDDEQKEQMEMANTHAAI